ncbi:unnamed protein product [Amoebophrya sp. A25]|nr:unnamed protein product [Amoebophrya sp. A25]|eukprot:GSA25T00002753001.1
MGASNSTPQLSDAAEKNFLAAIKEVIAGNSYSNTIEDELGKHFDGFHDIGENSVRERTYNNKALLKYYQELFYLLVKKYAIDTKQLKQSKSKTKEIRVAGSPEELLNSLHDEASTSSTTDELWGELCGNRDKNNNKCRQDFKDKGNALIKDVFGLMKESLDGNLKGKTFKVDEEQQKMESSTRKIDKFTLRRAESATPTVMLRRSPVDTVSSGKYNFYIDAVLVVPFEGEFQKNSIRDNRATLDTWNFKVDALMLLGQVQLEGAWNNLHWTMWYGSDGGRRGLLDDLPGYSVLEPLLPVRQSPETKLTVSHDHIAFHLLKERTMSFLQTRSFDTLQKDAGNVRVEGGVKVSPANSKTAGLIPAQEQTDVEIFRSASASSSTAVSGHGAVHDHVSNKVMENTLRSAQLQADTSSISGSITTDIRAAGADTPTPDEHEVCEQECNFVHIFPSRLAGCQDDRQSGSAVSGGVVQTGFIGGEALAHLNTHDGREITCACAVVLAVVIAAIFGRRLLFRNRMSSSTTTTKDTLNVEDYGATAVGGAGAEPNEQDA